MRRRGLTLNAIAIRLVSGYKTARNPGKPTHHPREKAFQKREIQKHRFQRQIKEEFGDPIHICFPKTCLLAEGSGLLPSVTRSFESAHKNVQLSSGVDADKIFIELKKWIAALHDFYRLDRELLDAQSQIFQLFTKVGQIEVLWS